MKDQHLISVDELRAAGALDVPAAWRKSLGEEREQMTLFGEDDMLATKRQPAPDHSDGDATADDHD